MESSEMGLDNAAFTRVSSLREPEPSLSKGGADYVGL